MVTKTKTNLPKFVTSRAFSCQSPILNDIKISKRSIHAKPYLLFPAYYILYFLNSKLKKAEWKLARKNIYHLNFMSEKMIYAMTW